MNKLGIPANADNKVVAGENAKVMTEDDVIDFMYFDGGWKLLEEIAEVRFSSYRRNIRYIVANNELVPCGVYNGNVYVRIFYGEIMLYAFDDIIDDFKEDTGIDLTKYYSEEEIKNRIETPLRKSWELYREELPAWWYEDNNIPQLCSDPKLGERRVFIKIGEVSLIK